MGLKEHGRRFACSSGVPIRISWRRPFCRPGENSCCVQEGEKGLGEGLAMTLPVKFSGSLQVRACAVCSAAAAGASRGEAWTWSRLISSFVKLNIIQNFRHDSQESQLASQDTAFPLETAASSLGSSLCPSASKASHITPLPPQHAGAPHVEGRPWHSGPVSSPWFCPLRIPGYRVSWMVVFVWAHEWA